MSSFAERFREEGMKQGKQEGMQQGMQQGEALLLTRQLTRKFGPLPDHLQRKIQTADQARLLEWSDRLLTAKTLEEVLH